MSHFNSSEPLIAGALWRCRGNGDCQDWADRSRSEQLFMSGGAGYVLSKEAVRRFREGQETSCRPGNSGPEDVEMSRCLQRLGVSFIDTRDSQGRWSRNIEKTHSLVDNIGPGSITSHQRTPSI